MILYNVDTLFYFFFRSLGCTLIELATGKPPYSNMIAMSAMFRIVEDDYPPLPDNISFEMQEFLKQCFQKDPENRPNASELKQHPWILSHKQQCPSLVSAEQPSTCSSPAVSSPFGSISSSLSSPVTHPPLSGNNTCSNLYANTKRPTVVPTRGNLSFYCLLFVFIIILILFIIFIYLFIYFLLL